MEGNKPELVKCAVASMAIVQGYSCTLAAQIRFGIRIPASSVCSISVYVIVVYWALRWIRKPAIFTDAPD